jgi:hypothetical protein
MCRKLSTAKRVSFWGAANWLPLDRRIDSFVHTTKEIDWNSLMIYPTRAGGKEDQPGGGRRQILVKENGDEIEPVLEPSPRDIKAIEILYGYKSGVSGVLLGDSKLAEKFHKIRRNDPDNQCDIDGE